MASGTPPPPHTQRGIWRWILLLANGGILGIVALAYPQLSASAPAVFTGNTTWLILTLWGGLVILHLGVVLLLELREGYLIRRKLRTYERELGAYNRQKIKQRLES